MILEVRKIHVIEEILKVDNDLILKEIESILHIREDNQDKATSILDFAGIITPEEAEIMRKAIAETCERIDSDDWK